MSLVKMVTVRLNFKRSFPRINSFSGNMCWKPEHRSFCVEHFIKTSPIIETQRAFRTHFNIHRNRSVYALPQLIEMYHG